MADGTTSPPTSPPPSPVRNQDITTYYDLMMVLNQSDHLLWYQSMRLELSTQLIVLLHCAFVITALHSESLLTYVRERPSVFSHVAFAPLLLVAGLMAWTVCEYLLFIGGYNEKAAAYVRLHRRLFNTPPREDYIADGKKAWSRLIGVCKFGSLASVLLTHVMINFVVYEWTSRDGLTWLDILLNACREAAL